VVTRLSARLGLDRVPLPTTVWGNTALSLPAGAPRVWTDALTDREITSRARRGDRARLAVSDVLADLPVALIFGGSAKQPF
jgi:maltooligosyltrehalose synthase